MNIKKVIIENGAIQKLPMVLNELAVTGSILLVADNRTYRVAGELVKQFLVKDGFQLREAVLDRDAELIPDEKALGEILIGMEPGIEVLVAVGSGSITDLTRLIAYRFGKPFIAVPTAPSMDGYASPVAALTINGYKQTLNAKPPVAIIADPDILAKAPVEMIRSGFGDLLGKYTALADWKLSSIINGEAYSEEIAAKVRMTVDQTVADLQGTITSPETIRNLMDGLIVSGEAMLAWGNSRPASGAEHHLAHFWEMSRAGAQATLTGKKYPAHGIKVGVATILAAGIYHWLFNLELTELKRHIAQYRPEPEASFRARIHRVYGPLAGDILNNLKGCYQDRKARAARQERIVANWKSMGIWVKDRLPAPERLRELLSQTGAPVEPSEIGVQPEMVTLALQNAKELRERYTVFRLAEDIHGSNRIALLKS